MVNRKGLANIAKIEAQRNFHGAVMKMDSNIQPIIALFPGNDGTGMWSLDDADGMWCAAFVYYCCIKTGFKIPIKPLECTTSNLAGCYQWEEWAKADKRLICFLPDSNDFLPETGDIVLFNNVFMDHEHDHIGIVIENKNKSIIVAEGNINNVSGVVERKKDSYIRTYIRIPDDYDYDYEAV